MGLFGKMFEKKNCDICGGEIGLLGNKKLEDGNLCKECASKLSPWFSDRRRSTVDQIREQLDWREANQQRVAQFNPTRTLGNDMKVILDEDAGRFIVTRSSRWREANPDVLDFSQVTGCDTEIRESRTELHWKDSDGEEHDYDPPRYDVDYDMYLTIHVNVPYYDSISFKVNGSRIEERNSVEYREAERQANEIRAALTELRETTREAAAAPSAEPPPRRMLLGAANTAAAPWAHKLQGEEPKRGSGAMKRTTKIAIAIAAVFALCLGLVGCGGGDGADYTKNFTGDWKLSGMTENGEAMSGDDIAFMESFGMTVTLTLNEDGTGSLVMFDEAMDVSWEPKSATELDVTIDGDTTTGKLADDTITLEAGGDSMSFVRVEADAGK